MNYLEDISYQSTRIGWTILRFMANHDQRSLENCKLWHLRECNRYWVYGCCWRMGVSHKQQSLDFAAGGERWSIRWWMVENCWESLVHQLVDAMHILMHSVIWLVIQLFMLIGSDCILWELYLIILNPYCQRYNQGSFELMVNQWALYTPQSIRRTCQQQPVWTVHFWDDCGRMGRGFWPTAVWVRCENSH